MPDTVTMIGFDFGSTTSSAMAARADIGLSATSGRMKFEALNVLYRSEPVFTPFNGREIDRIRLNHYIDRWIAESGVICEDIFAGGVIITGLAAERTNAAAIACMVGARIGEAVVATADDPCLESWLAFMGSCSVLSRFHEKTPFINIDIGGGTTNAAFGINGSVLHTGCHFVGARHFQFEPGSYKLVGMSSYGRSLLANIGIKKGIGDRMTSLEKDAVLKFYVAALEAIATGNTSFFTGPDSSIYQQVPFAFDKTDTAPVVVFSGGVGELIYRQSQGDEIPGTTHYGDLGIDLAMQIIQSPILSTDIGRLVPENLGRATVYGLTLHSTEVSGSTIFISTKDVLPCRNLPIVARLSIDAEAESIHHALSLAGTSLAGACIQILPARGDNRGNAGIPRPESVEKVKALGTHIHDACRRVQFKQTVVLLVPDNYGQALGNYATNWRQSAFNFIVIDEIPDRQAHFVNIGRLHNNIVPVSFYGVC